MGFGFLLMGYFCVNVMALYPPLSAAMLVGYTLMLIGLFRLAPYHVRLRQCRVLGFLSLPFAVYYTVYGLSASHILPEISFFSSFADRVIDWIYFAFTLVFQAILLYAIASLSGELGVTKLQASALRNLIFVAIYHVFYLVANLPFALIQQNIGLLSLPVAILRLLCVFFNLWLFFCCYRTILPEGSDVTPKLPDLMGEVKNKEK